LIPTALIHAPPLMARSDSTFLGGRGAGALEPLNWRFNARPYFLGVAKHVWISLKKRI
jgi:hypothetical protein